ncbi:MAG: methyltransferase domain-containing protein [Halobacteriaceae archaeon]
MTDVFGRLLRDHHAGGRRGTAAHVRSDGVSWAATCARYFAPPSEWSATEREMVAALGGRVLDAGCGAGRTALCLRDRESVASVVAADRSPGAVRVARDRGVDRAVVADIDRPGLAGPFDGVAVLGGQVAATGTLAALREQRLAALAAVTAPGGRLVADLARPTEHDRDGLDGDGVDVVDDGVYRRRFRLAYAGATGPWIDLLLFEPAAAERVLSDHPDWALVETAVTESQTWVALERR